MKPSITPKEKPVSDGQKEQFVRVVTDATRKSAGVAIDELTKSGVINPGNLQRLMARGDELVSEVTALVKRKLAEYAEITTGCLKLISGGETLTLDPTDGAEMIGKSANLFNGYLDSDYKNYGCNVKSNPTEAQNVQVHEMVRDGDFKKIYGCLGDTLDALCLTQPQIIQFVRKHRKWLRTDGYGTFFLFKVGKEFFVAFVDVFSGGLLYADVYRFDIDYVWLAEYRPRVVLPQQALGN